MIIIFTVIAYVMDQAPQVPNVLIDNAPSEQLDNVN